ncbi:MAG: VOC family protein [Planctomycetota bacterium]
MPVVTTLSLAGQTEAALQHYQDVLDAEILFLMRFRHAPDQSHTRPGMEDLIFHATFRVLDTVLMASDVGYESPDSRPSFNGFSLLLQMPSADRAERAFEGLSEEGQIVVPFAKSKFTSWYGVVEDRFGVSWKLNVAQRDD